MVLNFKVGTFEKIGTVGTQDITGVGFTPKVVILLTAANVSLNTFEGNTGPYFGAASSTSSSQQRAFFNYLEDFDIPTEDLGGYHSSHCWMDGDFVPNITQLARISALNSDGFTVNWLTNDTLNWRIAYIVIGGDSLTNDLVGSFIAPSSTGNFSVTGVGFQPDIVFLLGTNITSNDTIVLDRASWCLGVMNKNGEQAVISNIIRDNVSTTDTARYQRTNKCLAMFDVSDTSSLTHEATFQSMDSNGFTINFSTASAANKRVIYIAMKGPKTKIGSFNSPTAGSTPVSQSISTVGFLPKGIILLSDGHPTSGSIESHARYSIGAANSSASEICCWGGNEDGSSDQSITSAIVDDDACIRVSDEATSAPSTTTQALADFTQFISNGFTNSWSVRDASNAYEIIYIAFAEASNLYTRSATAFITVTDTVAKKRKAPIALSEMPVISDAVAKSKYAPRSVSDSLTLTDSVTKVKRMLRDISESLEVSAAISRFKRAIRLIFPIAGE